MLLECKSTARIYIKEKRHTYLLLEFQWQTFLLIESYLAISSNKYINIFTFKICRARNQQIHHTIFFTLKTYIPVIGILVVDVSVNIQLLRHILRLVYEYIQFKDISKFVELEIVKFQWQKVTNTYFTFKTRDIQTCRQYYGGRCFCKQKIIRH